MALLANVDQVISLLNSSLELTLPLPVSLSVCLPVSLPVSLSALSLANLLLQSPVMACVNFNCVVPRLASSSSYSLPFCVCLSATLSCSLTHTNSLSLSLTLHCCTFKLIACTNCDNMPRVGTLLCSIRA